MASTETAGDASAPEIVRIEGVSKRFILRKDKSLKERLVTLGSLGRQHREDFWALRDVDVTISAGSTVGLIGHNGSGKSTLLKVIGGIIDPTSGSVSRRGRIAALLELGAGFHPDLTGRENVFLNASILGLTREETEARFHDIVAFAGIGEFIDTQVKFYSSGMYVRLAFAVAINTDPDLLLVDEVLAVGDEAFQRKCLDKIREFQAEGRTIILVSHALGQVAELCDRVILLHEGRVVIDGEAEGAIVAFRDLLEERRVSSLGDEKAAEGPRVAGVEVHGAQGAARPTTSPTDEHADAPRVSIAPGSDLVVDFHIEPNGHLTEWMIGVQIDNTAGQPVYITTTDRLGYAAPDIDAPHAVRLTLKDVRFGPGKYFVNASVMTRSGVHLHDSPQAASFDAPGNGRSLGTLYAEAEFTAVG